MNSSRQSFRREIQRGDLADVAQAVLEGVSMHMERAGARRCLHVVREPRRQRAPQLAVAVVPREAAQWTAQFVGPPALAQAGEQHRQGEFVVAVDRRLRAMAAPGVQRGARGLPGTHEAIVATEIPAEDKTGWPCPRRPGVRAGPCRRPCRIDAAAGKGISTASSRSVTGAQARPGAEASMPVHVLCCAAR